MREWLRLFKAGNWRLRASLIAHPFWSWEYRMACFWGNPFK